MIPRSPKTPKQRKMMIAHSDLNLKVSIQPLGWEDPLEKGMATHSSILAWRIPWTEELGGLQSMGPQKARHDWATKTFFLEEVIRSGQQILPELDLWPNKRDPRVLPYPFCHIRTWQKTFYEPGALYIKPVITWGCQGRTSRVMRLCMSWEPLRLQGDPTSSY